MDEVHINPELPTSDINELCKIEVVEFEQNLLENLPNNDGWLQDASDSDSDMLYIDENIKDAVDRPSEKTSCNNEIPQESQSTKREAPEETFFEHVEDTEKITLPEETSENLTENEDLEVPQVEVMLIDLEVLSEKEFNEQGNTLIETEEVLNEAGDELRETKEYGETENGDITVNISILQELAQSIEQIATSISEITSTKKTVQINSSSVIDLSNDQSGNSSDSNTGKVHKSYFKVPPNQLSSEYSHLNFDNWHFVQNDPNDIIMARPDPTVRSRQNQEASYPIHVCLPCNKQFLTMVAFDEHAKKNHMCSICHIYFFDLKSHFDIHKDQNYLCDACGDFHEIPHSATAEPVNSSYSALSSRDTRDCPPFPSNYQEHSEEQNLSSGQEWLLTPRMQSSERNYSNSEDLRNPGNPILSNLNELQSELSFENDPQTNHSVGNDSQKDIHNERYQSFQVKCAIQNHCSKKRMLSKGRKISTSTTPLKTFDCEYCNKKFITSRTLYMHQFLHTSKQKFYCLICGKKYKTGAGLKRHCLHAHRLESDL